MGVRAGVWDGVTLMWHRDGGANMGLRDFSLMQSAHFTYLWDESEREFVNDKDVSVHWKFSRHFLASKSDHGHWIVEGDIPVRCLLSSRWVPGALVLNRATVRVWCRNRL
jgi:hypothetical protein